MLFFFLVTRVFGAFFFCDKGVWCFFFLVTRVFGAFFFGDKGVWCFFFW